jgi:hypothetical protein
MQYTNPRFDTFTILHEHSSQNTSLQDLPEDLAKSVRMSDPVVWPILKTTHDIINTTNLPWKEIANEVGIIVVGNAFPKQYTKKIVNELSEHGRVSPLSFINANAGAAISICCTIYKFQGPTINFTASDENCHNIAAILAQQWLKSGAAKYIFFVIADENEQNGYSVNNKLITLNK